MALTLTTDGRRVEEFGDADSALSRAIDDPSVGLVVTDLKMPGKTGIELATELAAARPDVSVLLVTAFGDVDTLVKAKDLGTVDYVAKPVARDDLRLRASAALRRARQAGEIKQLRERLDKRYGFEAIIGVSSPMERVFDVLRKVAPTRMNVLITGESGTGKELVANALHHNSPAPPARLRGAQLRRDPEGDHRVGALRAREGGLHRRAREADRADRAGPRRDALPRRGLRDAARPAGEVPPGPRGTARDARRAGTTRRSPTSASSPPRTAT